MIFTKKWLKNMREKSEDDQRVAAFSIAFCFTAFIVVIWLVTIFGTIETPSVALPDFSLPEIEMKTENQAQIIDSVVNFFQGEETYTID